MCIKKRRFCVSILLVATIILFFGCSSAYSTPPEPQPAPPPTVVETPPPSTLTAYLNITSENDVIAEVEEKIDLVEPEPVNPYKDLVLTDQEKELLARMAYSEANNQEFDGQVAVILVALNRYLSDEKDFQGSLTDILLAKNQFVVGKTFTDTQMQAVEAALAGSDVLDLNTDVTFFSTGKLKYGSYFKTIGGHVFRTYH